MAGLVLLDVDTGVATVTLNRPDRLNAMTLEMAGELLEVLAALADDETVGVVVLTGAGRAFCAGADLGSGAGGGGESRTETQLVADVRHLVRTSQLLHDMPKVTIAAINGGCAGGGLAWAAACDLRYASTSAVFNTAFLRAGLPGDYGATWTLTHLLGTAKARELFLLSERIDAAEAERIGLVARVFPPDALMAEVRQIARQLLRRSPNALTALLQNLNDAQRLSFHEALEVETQRMVDCMLGDDLREAVRAFREKREPVFRSR